MDFLIATHNMGKRDELQRILKPMGIRVLVAEEAGVTLRDAEETGTTFEENAMIKAVSAAEDSGLPCIADDSGLVVDALDGRPGIYTARYGGEEMPYPEKIKKLVEEMQFGFDPIFYCGEESFASLSPEAKDAISHRGNALRRLAAVLPAYMKE